MTSNGIKIYFPTKMNHNAFEMEYGKKLLNMQIKPWMMERRKYIYVWIDV